MRKKDVGDAIQKLLRALPSMEKILSDPRLQGFEDVVDRESLKRICRDTLDRWRLEILDREVSNYDETQFFAEMRSALQSRLSPSLRPVINCTGVVVHTNLGRSCLADAAVKAVEECARGYSTLEYNLESGSRGQRNSHIEWLLCQITGAEAAIVVNNNASAVLLCLAALAAEKEAIVSRGELVEIGGSFRIPDIMKFAGTRLVEVGCTNRTHLKDYAEAITDETAILLKVHPSNFRITGFHAEVPREEMAHLAHKNGLLMVEDLGSGFLISGQELGLHGEASVTECLEAGADLVTFSGDKLLGGPQIGGIVGNKTIVDKLRKYPLLRALRCDKMTLAAMEATLRLYLKGQWKQIPTLARITASEEELRSRANALKQRIDSDLRKCCLMTDVVPVDDAVGGGAYPERPLPGWAVSIRLADGTLSAGGLQERLRRSRFPVIAGAQANALLLHLRTLGEHETDSLIDSLKEALGAEQ